jgi:galactokinase
VAEKSGAVKAEYNARRTAGLSALRKLGVSGFREALASPPADSQLASLDPPERAAFRHVLSEAQRVTAATHALRNNEIEVFGRLLAESHASLRDDLAVSHPALDQLVEAALASGALGARLTGAGFGGCAIILCKPPDCERIAAGLLSRFYNNRPGFVPSVHLFAAEPSAGALFA